MANFLQKLYGTISTIFQLGLSGPKLKNNGGVIEHRNNADTLFVIARAAAPVGDDDLVTKSYGDTNYAGVGFTEVSVATGDAVWTTIATIPVGTDRSVVVFAYLLAKEQSGGSGHGFWHAEALFYRTGVGALAQEGVTNTITYRRTPSGLIGQFSVSGNDILIQVRGIAATSYNWRAKYAIVEGTG